VDLGFLPTRAEVKFPFIDLSNICSPDIFVSSIYHFWLKRPTPRKKVDEKMIRKADFHTFVSLLPEKELNLQDETEFPALNPGKVRMESLAPRIMISEEYRALLGLLVLLDESFTR
jgi:hypothetical protein